MFRKYPLPEHLTPEELYVFSFFKKKHNVHTVGHNANKINKKGKIEPLLRTNYKRNFIFVDKVEIRTELKNRTILEV